MQCVHLTHRLGLKTDIARIVTTSLPSVLSAAKKSPTIPALTASVMTVVTINRMRMNYRDYMLFVFLGLLTFWSCVVYAFY